MMQIRLAELEELDRIMEIYAHARRFMAETGNPKQWGATNWPPRTLIEQDIRQTRKRSLSLLFCFGQGSKGGIISRRLRRLSDG